jgi:hypothetical protein
LETKTENSVELEASVASAEADVGAVAKAYQQKRLLYMPWDSLEQTYDSRKRKSIQEETQSKRQRKYKLVEDNETDEETTFRQGLELGSQTLPR